MSAYAGTGHRRANRSRAGTHNQTLYYYNAALTGGVVVCGKRDQIRNLRDNLSLGSMFAIWLDCPFGAA
jgi:hypothetical protein